MTKSCSFYLTGHLELAQSNSKKSKPTSKDLLHPSNRHNSNYDFAKLCQATPQLSGFVSENKYGNQSIDFSDPNAVKTLNRALLKHHYCIDFWDIPDGYLCPPIPGRVDYIHYLNDLLKLTNSGKTPKGNKVSVLDIGTGASCIYPLLGQRSYDWSYVASDIDPISIDVANQIIKSNKGLSSKIKCRLQHNAQQFFNGIIKADEYFDLTMSNPPFHESLAQATKGSMRKWNNLGKGDKQTKLNFGGQKAELWCKGGELTFIRNMIKESQDYRHQVLWFSSLVSKGDNIAPLKKFLKQLNVEQVKVVDMAQGNKVSRFIAWSYFSADQQQLWCKSRY